MIPRDKSSYYSKRRNVKTGDRNIWIPDKRFGNRMTEGVYSVATSLLSCKGKGKREEKL
jgi:hypothetical protein